MKKQAIILYNLGGPDNVSNIRNFLFNLFYDKNIIDLPNPLRWMIAKLISIRREKKAREIYMMMGGKSPILENTQIQAKKLEEKIADKNCRVLAGMRYWHPMVEQTAQEIDGVDEVFLIPLYPHFSQSTTLSYIEEFQKYYKGKVKAICCYPEEEKFIESHIKKINNYLPDKLENTILLFSAHGVPESYVKNGDPYQSHIEKTVQNIAKKLTKKYENLEYKICYQSRVGPVKWLGPNTDDLIIEYSKQKYTIVVIPIAFVSEHSETLVELDIEYKDLAKNAGCREYIRIPTLAADDLYIESLFNLYKTLAARDNNKSMDILSSCGKKICEDKFYKCLNNY